VTIQEVRVPDLGGSDAVDIIELCVNSGDQVSAEDSLIVLESDKATIEVPAPFAGEIVDVNVKVGDSVKEGDLIMTVGTADASAVESIATDSVEASDDILDAPKESVVTSIGATQTSDKTINIPDIGGADDVEIIEINVKIGDQLQAEDPLLVLETDKATMEVPCPEAGSVKAVLLKVGDKVSEGTPAIILTSATSSVEPKQTDVVSAATPSGSAVQPLQSVAPAAAKPVKQTKAAVHAGPAVRRLAYELGVNLAEVTATGPKKRIVKDDVQKYVHQQMTSKPAGQAATLSSGSGLPELPIIDFAKFGDVENQALSKINRVAANHLHRSWVHIPHVTQFDEADITALEAFRKAEAPAAKEEGVKLTLLAFLVKACVKALQTFPRFNSSLSSDGQDLVLKKYYHIGIAVDTPNGLVVPVIKNADTKTISDIALEMQVLSVKARDKKLMSSDMQGGCISISSLGGIGGTAFTPIVNWPEVAILGVSRSQMKPVYQNGEFVPKLMLPLSLSYDHRVIDGAAAARFTSYLSKQLGDIRRLLL